MSITTANGGGTYQATLTSSASVNTYGSWTELTASSAEAINGMMLSFVWAAGATRRFLVDIGTGAGGAETAVIATIPLAVSSGAAGFLGVANSMYIPISVAAGTRISARVMCSTGTSTVNLTAYLLGGTGSGSVVAYGAVAASSAGTTIDCGGVLNTYGSYTQVTSATSQDHTGLVVVIAGPIVAAANGTWNLDIATGASSSEVNLISQILFGSSSTNLAYIPQAWYFPVTVYSGTRLSARAKNDGTTSATTRIVTVVIYGVTIPVSAPGYLTVA